MFILPSVLLFATLGQATTPTVQLGNTSLTGTLTAKVESYRGIPYAEPPVGSLRFKPTVIKSTLSTPTFNASTFGAACLQPGPPSSEDCLTINIFRPAGLNKTDSLPVMAFIHGGGYTAGASSSYDGTALVARSVLRGMPIVYASFNYRLGPLGFPPGAEALARNALNLGLKDQRAAMQWMQDNIAAFNGDKSKVTLFGESAGAMSLGIHYLNSDLDQFARAVIFESGTAASLPIFDAAHGQSDWDNYVRAVPECAKYVGNDAIPCLQGVNSSALLTAENIASGQANTIYPWGPHFDGPNGLIPARPFELLSQGRFARVPFIMGTNLDEGTFFTTPFTNSTAMIEAYIISNYTAPSVPSKQLASAAEKLLSLYPDVPALGSPFDTGNETFNLSSQYKRYAAMMGDLLFQSQRRHWIQTASDHGVKTFGYFFTQPGSPPLALPPFTGAPAVLSEPETLEYLGVTHTAEIPYVFNFIGGTSLAANLSTQMADYWLSFATSLDPNDGRGSARPVWEQYTCNESAVLQLNGTNTTMIPDNYRAAQIAYINANAAIFSH
ncbi:esterase 1 [Mycena galericulata]|nr:esterase 1 [Mycena galericulata]